MTRRREEGSDVERVREAFLRADGGTEPDIRRLVDAVPALMAEAARRRRTAPRDPLSFVVPVARRAIPSLAAAAAVLMLASGVLWIGGFRSPAGATPGLDTLILQETVDEGSTDILLEAIVEPENGNG